MSEGPPEMLGYANPTELPPVYSERNAIRFKRLALTPVVGGFGILSLFAVSGWPILIRAGILWLIIGGVLAFLTFVAGLVMWLTIRGPSYENEAARRQYGWSILISLLAIPTAVICIFAGGHLIAWWDPNAF